MKPFFDLSKIEKIEKLAIAGKTTAEMLEILNVDAKKFAEMLELGWATDDWQRVREIACHHKARRITNKNKV